MANEKMKTQNQGVYAMLMMLFGLLLMLPVQAQSLSKRAQAKTEVVDGVTWHYETFSDGGKTCARIVEGKDKYVGDVTIPSTLKGCPVTSIKHGAFTCCSNLTSVTIPSSVKCIEGCTFSMCNALTSVIIPSSVTNIGASAFSLCKGLTSITISSSVTNIGNDAFSFCDELTAVNVVKGDGRIEVCSLGEFLKRFEANSMSARRVTPKPISKKKKEDTQSAQTAVIPTLGIKATEATAALFKYETKNGNAIVTGFHKSYSGDVKIPATLGGCPVVEIGSGAFKTCNMTSVEIPNSVTLIHPFAFANCLNLKTAVIPKGVKTLRMYVFSECQNLEKIEIHAELKSCDALSFSGSTKLRFSIAEDNSHFSTDGEGIIL